MLAVSEFPLLLIEYPLWPIECPLWLLGGQVVDLGVTGLAGVMLECVLLSSGGCLLPEGLQFLGLIIFGGRGFWFLLRLLKWPVLQVYLVRRLLCRFIVNNIVVGSVLLGIG